MNYLSPLSLFLSVFVLFFVADWEESQEISPCWLCLVYATCSFVLEPVLLFNICSSLYCHSQENRNKKPLFGCRGCNCILWKPIVLQKLHLSFSQIVCWGCGSSRRLDRRNYAASQSSIRAFPYSWLNVFLKPKVRIGQMNMFILFGCGSRRFMQKLSAYSYIFTQVRCTGQIL